MIFSDALELAIGLTFIYLLVSLILTAVIEGIEAVAKRRSKLLFSGICELLDQPGSIEQGKKAAEALYTHPLVQGLFRGDVASATKANKLPSYIPSRNFAMALVDQVLAGKLNATRVQAATDSAVPNAASTATLPAAASVAEKLRFAAERIENTHLRRAVRQAVDQSGEDIDKVTAHLMAWYDTAMDRVSGAFKRRTQAQLLVLGLVVAVGMNINSWTIAESLAKNSTLRRAVVAQAESYTPEQMANSTVAGTNAAIDRLGLPIGWSESGYNALIAPYRSNAVHPVFAGLQILIGFLVTAFAVTLGAPFWFDLLNKLMVIRATVKPHEKSKEEASEDRQTKGNTTVRVTMPEGPKPQPPTTADGTIDDDVYAEHPTLADRIFEDEDTSPAVAAAPVQGAGR